MHLSKLSQIVAKSAAGNMSGMANQAAAGMAGFRSRYTLPDLPYEYSALQPVISADIMKLHHQKHHATYVQNLNSVEEKLTTALQKGDLKGAIELQGALRFNGGGHINHTIFWKNLSPQGGKEPTGDLANAIKRDFGSFDNFKTLLSAAATQVQGSGWAWLGFNVQHGRLQIAQCANQDPLQSTTGLVPLLGIDVWEHAYYLDYKNVRADYVKKLWDIFNWNDVAERLRDASSAGQK